MGRLRAAQPTTPHRLDPGVPNAATRVVMDAAAIARALRRIAHEVVEANHGVAGVSVLGIPTRGVHLAVRLAAFLAEVEGSPVPVGSLDIGTYRDDLGTRPPRRLATTSGAGPVDGRTIVVVDDVLYTGRTIRAALDAISDLGRPGRVQVAVLVDRGHRELPIRADYVGKNLPTSVSERVTVHLMDSDGEEGVVIQPRDGGAIGRGATGG